MLHFLASFIKKKKNILTVLGIKMGHITIEVIEILSFVVIQLLSHICLFVAPWTVAYQILRPRLSPGVCSNSCPLNQWCHLTLSSSATPFSGGSDGKVFACNVGDLGLIPGLGRSPGEGNGNPLQNSCLENSVDWEAWWATVHGVAKSWTWLSDFALLSLFAFNLSQHQGLFQWVSYLH